MTFLICIFILLMQFLWRHVTDLVGKGIAWSVLGEFFIYSTFSLVPLALPLAILLASLMTFGNLGEHFELTAMKAAGISLFRIMRPLMIFISFICLAAFYFSNYILPFAQTKMYTLIISLKSKSPEFDIPVGEFYSGITGVNMNIYIRAKDKQLLKDLMIYDFSGGFDNATVMVADSGRVQFTEDNNYLLLTLYNGESFENLKKQSISNSALSVPYRRETFKIKEMLFDFDTKFNRYNESLLQDQHVSKNIKQLSQSIDSVGKIAKLKSLEQSKEMVNRHYLGREQMYESNMLNINIKNKKILDADSLFLSFNQELMLLTSQSAIEHAKSMKGLIQYNQTILEDSTKYVMRHEIEFYRKFTLSFACLIFFFIGAPLGAIIRKGGLGTPIVISVIMFIFYYIIDNTGYKMAREGLWTAFNGMWLSSSVLLPIGIFLTYKAVVDANLLSTEQFNRFYSLLKTSSMHFFKRFNATK